MNRYTKRGLEDLVSNIFPATFFSSFVYCGAAATALQAYMLLKEPTIPSIVFSIPFAVGSTALLHIGNCLLYSGIKDGFKEYKTQKLIGLSELSDEKLNFKQKLKKRVYQGHEKLLLQYSQDKLPEKYCGFTEKREYPHAAKPGDGLFGGFDGRYSFKKIYSFKIPAKRKGILDEILPRSFIKISYNQDDYSNISLPLFVDENDALKKINDLLVKDWKINPLREILLKYSKTMIM